MNKQELIEKYKSALNKVHKAYGYYYKTEAYEEVLKDLKQLNEPQKVTVPQFIADWIKKCKTFEHLISLSFALNPISWKENRLSDECIDWLKSTSNQEVFARSWLDGYEVEKEPKYTVKMTRVEDIAGFLNFGRVTNTWFMSDEINSDGCCTHHTRKELEKAGFGEVFNSPLFEVEEVGNDSEI